MKKAIFYHDGCPACADAEQGLVAAIDRSRYDVEMVNLAKMPELISRAEQAGVTTLPAVVIDGKVYHINFGGTLRDFKEKLGQYRVEEAMSWETADCE